jgi:retinol dehydrogenase-12
MSDLLGRTFVVTGANTGIGRETARQLALRGGRVVLACRSSEKTRPVMDAIAKEAGADRLGFVALDLGSLDSVRHAAAELLEREPRIDVLVNNAGLTGRGLTRDGFELAFGVNHLGPFLLTLLLLDRIRASEKPRIVNVASASHYRAPGIDFEAQRKPTQSLTGVPEYGVSKLCNVLFTRELARRLEGSGVTTYSLHPGVVASDVWRRIPWPARSIAKLFMISVEEGAKTTLHCATAPDVADQSGLYYDKCAERRPSRLARSDELARELWDKSAAWVGLG